ncbi:MAG: AsmA family protein, partial [Acidobacteria bacterium]
MKTLFKILGIILLLLVILVVVVIIRFDADELGQRVLTWVNQETDIDLQAERFALHPLKGLELVNAEIHTMTEAGDATVNLDRLLFEHEVWPLLKGELVIHRILLDKPQTVMVAAAEPVAEGGKGSGPGGGAKEEQAAPAEPAEPAAPAEGDTAGLTVSIAEIRIEDGSLVTRTEGVEGDDLDLQGLDLVLTDLHFDPTAPTSIEGFAAQGGISVDQIRAGDFQATGTEGQITIDRGKTAITDFGVSTANGELQVSELAVDVTHSPATYNLSVG